MESFWEFTLFLTDRLTAGSTHSEGPANGHPDTEIVLFPFDPKQILKTFRTSKRLQLVFYALIYNFKLSKPKPLLGLAPDYLSLSPNYTSRP
jgi:hypothetical protein